VTQPLRADAQRNLGRVLDAAAEVLAEHGSDVSVDEIARRAGVGHGTVFRRFPTMDALIAAVVVERLHELIAAAEEALTAEDAAEAFRGFMLRVAQQHARDRRLFECFDKCVETPELTELHRLGEQLVERAKAAGAVRPGLTAADVETIFGATLRAAPPGLAEHYAEIVLAGLRPPA
jgi:AcrR family transcriptional regulator